MNVVLGLSVVIVLAMANAEAKEIKAKAERFGRLSIFFSSIEFMPPKAFDIQTRRDQISPRACGGIRLSCRVRISLSIIAIYTFTAAAMTNTSKVFRLDDEISDYPLQRQMCQIYDILLKVTSKNCSKPLRKTVILTFSPTFLL
jgi:hypothetical protein